jgi:hypothetical protein
MSRSSSRRANSHPSPETRKETAAACKAAADEARKKDRPKEEQAALTKWNATGDPEAAAYQSRLQVEQMELLQMRQAEEDHVRRSEYPSAGRDNAPVWACMYRDGWKARKRGTYEDTS